MPESGLWFLQSSHFSMVCLAVKMSEDRKNSLAILLLRHQLNHKWCCR